MNGLLGSAGQMSPFPQHQAVSPYGSGPHGHSNGHLGSMYGQHQRSSFAIQELLGLNSACRSAGGGSQTGASPDPPHLGDGHNGSMMSHASPGAALSSMYPFPAFSSSSAAALGSAVNAAHRGMTEAVNAAHRGMTEGHNAFLREQPMASSTPGFCPWRFDPLTSQGGMAGQGMSPTSGRFGAVGMGPRGDELSYAFKHSMVDDGE